MPHGETLCPLFGRYIDTVMTIQNRRFTLTGILSELSDRYVNEYWVVFEARSSKNDDRVIVKARFE